MSLDISLSKMVMTEVASINITHNLGEMAEVAGLYEFVWHPEDHGIRLAEELILPLQEGLRRLKSDPDRFRAFNPRNGWGSYEGLVDCIETLLERCREHPDAVVSAST